MLREMNELGGREAAIEGDRLAIEFIRYLLLDSTDDETAEIALEVIESGYLEEQPQLCL